MLTISDIESSPGGFNELFQLAIALTSYASDTLDGRTVLPCPISVRLEMMKNTNLNLAKCGRGVTVSHVFQHPAVLILAIVGLAVLFTMSVTGGVTEVKSSAETSPKYSKTNIGGEK